MFSQYTYSVPTIIFSKINIRFTDCYTYYLSTMDIVGVMLVQQLKCVF